MLQLYGNLFLEFFKIGLFSFGGGYATIPFLYHISQTYHWFSPSDLEKMIAVASITPGPVGINMATYSGMQSGGVLGSLIATTSIILPALFIVILISKILKKFKENFIVKSAVYGLKPAACGLLSAVAIDLIKNNLVSGLSIGIFVVFLLLSFKIKKDPIFYLAATGLIGLVLKFCHFI